MSQPITQTSQPQLQPQTPTQTSTLPQTSTSTPTLPQTLPQTSTQTSTQNLQSLVITPSSKLDSPVGHQPVPPIDIKIEEYPGGKSFKVSGEGTRLYKEQLKNQLGGRYNPKLAGGPGWIFPLSKLNEAKTWLDEVKRGVIPPDVSQQIITTTTGGMSIISVTKPYESDYQVVQWKVFKPKPGMRVNVKAAQVNFDWVVDAIASSSNNNIIDTVYMSDPNKPLPGDQRYVAVITNGKWQVSGINQEHSVKFTKIETQ